MHKIEFNNLNRTFVIAEIGITMREVLKLQKNGYLAAKAGVDAVKFILKL